MKNWMDGKIDGWKDEWMERCTDGTTNRWLDKYMTYFAGWLSE